MLLQYVLVDFDLVGGMDKVNGSSSCLIYSPGGKETNDEEKDASSNSSVGGEVEVCL